MTKTDHEEHVADTGGEERLLGRIGCTWAFVVEPDEKVGAETHDLPEDEQPKEGNPQGPCRAYRNRTMSNSA